MSIKCSNRTLWTQNDEDGYPYWVEFEDRPFAKGNSKFMYKGRLNGRGPRSGDYCTLKVFRTIEMAQREDWSLYVNRLERANKLASQFNKMMDNQYKVRFVHPMTALVDISSTCTDCIYFFSNTKRIKSDDCVVIEPYIGRKFRKFYRNSPLKGAEHAYILQAFSHFTASQTGDTLICGLQGIAREDEFILTNPIIHSANQEWGAKDQGPHGFRKFFTAHTCNHICQSMDLPEYLETMSVAEEIDKEIAAETSAPKIEAPIVSEEVSQVTAVGEESVPQAEAQVSEEVDGVPEILQTPPMSRSGRTIIAPVSVEMTMSRASSVTGPPEFVEDLPGESIILPSEILDATPIDDIAPQMSSSQEVLPPPSSEYSPCKAVEDYLELKKSIASFSPGSETIPMIDDEFACAESELRDVLPPPIDDFEPIISPSIDSYMKDKESLEIIPHGSMDLDSESQPSISVFEDSVPAADLGSMNNFQETPRESVTQEAEVFESLENTPCATMSQESLVTTPCGSIRQEIESQPSVDSLTPKDSVSQDLAPVSEAPLETEFQSELQEAADGHHDIESTVCLESIPPDCMDHHLDTLESLEALSPASEKLRSVSLGEETAEPVVEEQVGDQEFSETLTTQESYPIENVEDTVSSDFKQSLETIPEVSTESDSAHSVEIEAPEGSTMLEEEKVAEEMAEGGTVAEGETVETTDTSGQVVEATPAEIASEETVAESAEAGVSAEDAVMAAAEGEAQGEATVCEGDAAEAVEEATVPEETAAETTAEAVGEAAISQENTVETTAEPEGEAAVSQETTLESTVPAEEAEVTQETTAETIAEPVEEAAVAQETAVETAAEPVEEAAIAQETLAETSAEPAGESEVAQETTVETTSGPDGEAAVTQETTVETAAEPIEEAAVTQETTVETCAEPAGEAAVTQETTVETAAEPVEEAAITQETTVETSAEPVGEAAVSQETTVETTEPAGEVAVTQETTVETTAVPDAETAVAQETTVETTEPAGEATVIQETAVEAAAQPSSEAVVSQETTAEAAAEPGAAQEAAVETTVESHSNQEAETAAVSQEVCEPTAQESAIGDANLSQGNIVEPAAEVSQEIAIESTGVSSQDLVVESTDGMPGEGYNMHGNKECYVCQDSIHGHKECYVCQDSGLGSTIGTIREGYVCPDSAVETTVESSNVEATEGGYSSQDSDFGPTSDGYTNVEATADGYTSQDSGISSVVDTNPTVTYDSDPGSNTYSKSYTPVTSSYPTKAINTITSSVPDQYYYGVPPEYRISETCDASQCEPGCPQRYTKMTIVPDLDTMEYVETKCLDPVYEEHENQQGIETLPRRRVSYYLEPQESHEIITFRINISPELPRPEQKSDEYVYSNGGTSRQCSNDGESGLNSSRYCPNCQPRESSSETVVETSTQDNERSASFYSYHYSETSDCSESMPQRSCGYSAEVHQNMPSDWSPTHSNWDDGQCSTGQNLPTTPGVKVDSKFGPSV